MDGVDGSPFEQLVRNATDGEMLFTVDWKANMAIVDSINANPHQFVEVKSCPH